MTVAEGAARLIPGGSQTISKRRDQFPANAPLAAWRAKDTNVFTSDARVYIDWTAALGAISLGYGHPEVVGAVHSMINAGPIFGLSHPIELELAEALVPLMPWPDPMFRFGLSGSDACAASLMLAREITERNRISSRGYHGWILRIDDNVLTADSIGRYDDDRAAIIVEPNDPPLPLSELRALCDREGSLLIFDEVLTGFRYAGYTYAAYSKVTPDLICLGKAIANGYPLSVLAGPRRYMKKMERVWWSGTHFGSTIGLAAAIATIYIYTTEPVINRLWAIGRTLRSHWAAETQRLGLDIPCIGDPPLLRIVYPTAEIRTLVMQEMFRRGQMFTVGFTPTYAHSDEDVDAAKTAISETLEVVAEAGEQIRGRIEGEIARPVMVR